MRTGDNRQTSSQHDVDEHQAPTRTTKRRGTMRRRIVRGILCVAAIATFALSPMLAQAANAGSVMMKVPEWGQKQLAQLIAPSSGVSPGGLAAEGCYATSLAMIANYYGSNRGFADSISYMIKRNVVRGSDGYILVNQAAAISVLGGTATLLAENRSFDRVAIKAELAAGHLVQAHRSNHTYVIIGYEGDTFLMNDPWTGAPGATNGSDIKNYDVYGGTHARQKVWNCKYYAGMNPDPNASPIATATAGYIGFNWGNGSPAGVPADRFSAIFTMECDFTADVYRFNTYTDDGVRLYVDGTVVIDQWKDMPATSFFGSKALDMGPHVFEMRYYENGGGAIAKLTYTKTTPTPTPTPADTNIQKILRNGADGRCYLITLGAKRAEVASGGDLQAMLNNNVKLVESNWATISKYPDAGYKAVVRRMDDPAISGPSNWLNYRTTGGYENDYVFTQSAAGKPYVTNEAVWTLPSGYGRVRVKCYIPSYDAAAVVVYHVFDGGREVGTFQLDQATCRGQYVTMGEWDFTSGAITIKLRDNEGQRYGYNIGIDMCEAVPIG